MHSFTLMHVCQAAFGRWLGDKQPLAVAVHAVAPMLDDELCAQQMAAVCEIWMEFLPMSSSFWALDWSWITMGCSGGCCSTIVGSSSNVELVRRSFTATLPLPTLPSPILDCFRRPAWSTCSTVNDSQTCEDITELMLASGARCNKHEQCAFWTGYGLELSPVFCRSVHPPPTQPWKACKGGRGGGTHAECFSWMVWDAHALHTLGE